MTEIFKRTSFFVSYALIKCTHLIVKLHLEDTASIVILLFINDMHKAITNGTLRHFADDTNLLIVCKSVKTINREVNYNLRLLINDWLKANKLSFNPSKTEIIIFKVKTKNITKHLSLRLSGQKIHIKNNVKYLEITTR